MLAVGLTVAIRFTAIYFTPTAMDADPDAYQAIARTIGETGVFGLTGPGGVPRPIAFRPPLYPWILSLSVSDGQLSRVAVASFHLLLAGLTAGIVFCTTRRLVENETDSGDPQVGLRLGLAAAVLTAIDPILLRQSTEVMTETLAATLTTAAIWFWCSRCNESCDESQPKHGLANTVALGGGLALAYLCRPTFLVWAVLLVVASAVRTPNRRGLISAAIIASCVAAAVAGWTIRNQRTFGHPIWATTHGGYTLLLANNDSFYRYLSQGRFGQAWDAGPFLNAYQHRYEADPREAVFWQRDWSGKPTYHGAVSEYEDDRLCYESAVATIKRQPKLFVWSTLVRAARLWSPLPHDVSGRSKMSVIAVGGYYVVLYAAVLVAIIRHRRFLFRNRWWAIWLLAITLTGVHAVYWSNLRMRAPIMPAIAIIAVFSIAPKRPRDLSR